MSFQKLFTRVTEKHTHKFLTPYQYEMHSIIINYMSINFKNHHIKLNVFLNV